MSPFSPRFTFLVLFSLIGITFPERLPERTPDAPKQPAISLLTLRAGYIFTGTVKAVHREHTGAGRVATMQITFHVDKALRGVRAGQSLVIHEWEGLWEAGERYRPGEQMLLFLYPPSKLGLTSAIGGAAGRFKVDEAGQVILGPVTPLTKNPILAARLQGKTRISALQFLRNLKLAGGE